jgi:limonene-1,2-epoxide hydrolase
MGTPETPEALVLRFCDAWSAFDVDAILEFFTDDAVYHNIPIAPVRGRDEIRTTIAGFTAGVDRLEFKVLNVASNGNVVLTERVDYFHMGERTVELPVMGTFEVEGGRIKAWRDYFDMNQFMSQLSG